jgi:hypothetical protein
MTDFDLHAADEAAATAAAPPCPWWCEERQPHRWRYRDHTGVERVRKVAVAEFDPADVTVEQLENNDTAPASLQIAVYDHSGGSLGAAQARQFATALLNAADKIDEINA